MTTSEYCDLTVLATNNSELSVAGAARVFFSVNVAGAANRVYFSVNGVKFFADVL
jgi:hypothetical protein